MKSKKEIKIEKKEIDSQVFIQTIEAVAGSITMEKSIKFIMNVKEVPQKFVADEELIQRAIVNVISNAIDYTPINGQILFEVDTNNDYIRFIVEDSGRGFTKEELKYATEQFFQGDKSRNSKLHYGMGLYIVKESLKQLKGNICLENSKETGGAKVSLEIPID
jgi:signal transduction histidine kinase